MFPGWAGSRHARKGREPDAPKADWFEKTFMPKRTKEINKERSKYYRGYDQEQRDQRRARNARNKDK